MAQVNSERTELTMASISAAYTMDRVCPTCQAAPGSPCMRRVKDGWQHLETYHLERLPSSQGTVVSVPPYPYVYTHFALPTVPQERKNVPLYSGLIKYFPDALVAVAAVSKAGNDQHNLGQELMWDRTKSTDEHDALTRHLFQAGTVDTDGHRHSAKVAWRSLAALQKEIENAATNSK